YYGLSYRGYPLNYIVGYREFYSRRFRVTGNTLIPRPETELLVDEVLKLSPRVQDGASVLDLGTGSGVIAVSIKLELPHFKVDAVDKFPQTLAIAQFNAKNLNAEVNFYISNWYTNIKNQYDIIVSNPPYIAKDDKHLANLTFEPQAALTDFGDGLGCLRHIIGEAANYLKLNGWLIVEHGFDQGQSVRNFYANAGFIKIKTIQDYASLDRITIGCKL
ncbi:MAG: peptide chain release factor N(5)-glutamine methyltransferase, partial [Burkholderiales bacterium]|nr:peptide chain release factor N(5)-glutamine methyltransferase [Burkholderiales bacterium]